MKGGKGRGVGDKRGRVTHNAQQSMRHAKHDGRARDAARAATGSRLTCVASVIKLWKDGSPDRKESVVAALFVGCLSGVYNGRSQVFCRIYFSFSIDQTNCRNVSFVEIHRPN